MGINKVKTYLKEKYLGKGGFAYCMQVVDLDDHHPNKRYAMKIMPKTMNGKTRSKEKIQSEVELLAQMNHPNVARLVRAFENDANVYMVMELCENQSLIELMRNRKRLTEIEVRSYIAQLVGGIQYIHAKNIVHRDLKLGNLFLTQNMQLKIGDFGLSERITYPNQKLNSLSGTPNYIAPEILTKTGHSYEVDIWAVGVIAYTMLVGSPPFQAKTSKATCSRIKQVLYSVPRHLQLSESCIDFIRCCLQKNPFDRIKIDEMFDHEFLQMPYPKLCPMSTLFQAPKELKIAYSTCNGGLSNANRAKSVTQMRRGTRSNQRFVEATDEDIAKDNLERDKSIKKQSKVDLKKVNRNIFSSTPIVEKLANEKQKFSTKMNISSLQSKYHPINNIDIPKVEISTGGSTPFNNSSSSITKLKYTVVTKYMNLPSKSGIGYQLSNGDIGILCNNGDKMLLKLKFDKIFYFDQYDILMHT